MPLYQLERNDLVHRVFEQWIPRIELQLPRFAARRTKPVLHVPRVLEIFASNPQALLMVKVFPLIRAKREAEDIIVRPRISDFHGGLGQRHELVDVEQHKTEPLTRRNRGQEWGSARIYYSGRGKCGPAALQGRFKIRASL